MCSPHCTLRSLAAVLSPTSSTIRLFLHVLAASVWVGGQLTLAGLVPTVRKAAPDATKAVANAFARIAWPAFAVAVATGLWNLMEVDITDTSSSYQATVGLHLTLAILSGVFAAVHALGNSVAAKAIGGGLGALAAIGALFLGVLLRTA